MLLHIIATVLIAVQVNGCGAKHPGLRSCPAPVVIQAVTCRKHPSLRYRCSAPPVVAQSTPRVLAVVPPSVAASSSVVATRPIAPPPVAFSYSVPTR